MRWELRYILGAAAFMALMGAWCFFAFAHTSDPVVQLLAFSIVLANMIGVAGRNFGSKLLVNAQLVCAGVPMAAALVLMGNTYLAVLGCVLVPFFISLKQIADRLRRTLLDAVVATRDVTLLAGRFDTALNNMPHGLCMFDPHGPAGRVQQAHRGDPPYPDVAARGFAARAAARLSRVRAH